MFSLTMPVAVLGFHLLVVLLVAARWARRRGAKVPVLDAPTDSSPPSTHTVSVIVPMRNEAANVRRCLGALRRLRGRILEVIVVDDHSDDDTLAQVSEIARADPRIRVVRGLDVPPPWVAKNFALQQGVGLARGEWLLFVDADVELHPDAAHHAAGVADAGGIHLLSLSPRQECGGFWERAIQPLVFAMLRDRFDMAAVNDPAEPVAAANGQFILVRRSVYDAVGGHAAVKDRVLEDVGLAEAVKRRGLRLHFANTRTLAATRMYDGFRALWYGWSKNLFPLLGGHAPTWRAVAWHLGIFALTGVSVVVAGGRAIGDPAWAWPALSGLIALVVLAVVERLDDVALGPPWSHPFVSPVAHAVFALLIVNSWSWHSVRKTVWWRGRRYRYHHREVAP
jgi:chlorobactene glucosyltransferase